MNGGQCAAVNADYLLAWGTGTLLQHHWPNTPLGVGGGDAYSICEPDVPNYIQKICKVISGNFSTFVTFDVSSTMDLLSQKIAHESFTLHRRVKALYIQYLYWCKPRLVIYLGLPCPYQQQHLWARPSLRSQLINKNVSQIKTPFSPWSLRGCVRTCKSWFCL